MGDRTAVDLHDLEQETQGRYQFVKVLGRGAYGLVVSAVEKATSHPVAIKRVERVFQSSLDAKRILREVRLHSRLKHENIANFLDVMTAADPDRFEVVVVVMDLMDTDLHQILSSSQPLLVEHHRYFVYQLLRGLKYIHSANVLHRDLKPGNLLLNANCDLKICDFGLARIAEPAGPDDCLTEYVATRWYRAPEVLLNYETYGPAMDVWSAGCILAELMLRRPLFPGTSTMNQLALITEVLGSPSAEDLRACASPKALAFMASLPARARPPADALFPGADPAAVDLAARMLTWDPDARIGVEEALEHPFLAQMHDPFDEPVAYPIPEFEFERSDVSLDELRALIWQEVLKYHPELQR
jgi:mitogen-activated protein kinase 1/3